MNLEKYYNLQQFLFQKKTKNFLSQKDWIYQFELDSSVS